MAIENQILELSEKQKILDCHQSQLWKKLVELENRYVNGRSHSSPKTTKNNQLKQSKICQIGKLLYWAVTLQLTERLSRRKMAQLISNSGLFDTGYYWQQNPEVKKSGEEPLGHYIDIGANQGAEPNPLFDTAYYLKNNPEVVTSGMNPLAHYLSIGTSEGKNPHPLFDTAYYLKNNPEVTTSGMNPLVHYLGTETSQGKNPHPLFDTAYYLKNNPEVVTFGMNPLVHHLTTGNNNNDYPILFADNLPLVASALISILSKTEILLTLLEEAKNIFFLEYKQPEVSIIIPVYNKLEYTLRCLKSLMYQKTSITFEVIVADDCSIDSTQEALSSIEGLKYIRNPENYGFLKSCNHASQEVRGQYIVILNNDTIALENWLEELISPFTTQKKVGLVGSMLLYPDGTLQEAGGLIWNDGSGWNFGREQDPNVCEYNFIRETDYCSGASIALTTQLWRQLEGFDPLFSPAYYEDTDLAFRVRQSGYKVIYTPFSKIVHFEGISSGTDLNSGVKRYQLVNQPKFLKRWQYDLVEFPEPPQSIENVNYHRNFCHKLLWIDATTLTPDRDAGSNYVFNFFKIVNQFGWKITFIPDNLIYDSKYTPIMQKLGVECIYCPYCTSIEQYIKKYASDFDVIVLSRVSISIKFLDLVRLYAPKSKLIFNTIDLHFLREARQINTLNRYELIEGVTQTFRDELLMILKSDLTIVVSNSEAQMLKILVPTARLSVIPLICEIQGSKTPVMQRSDICFVGGFNHPPNVDAVLFFISNIWPLVLNQLPNCRFVIAGSNVPDSILNNASENIIIKGFIPELGELFENIRLSVAPLRFGAGMKGKVVSSLSYGVPVIATTIATEGMAITSGKEAIIVDEPERFAQAIVDIYTSQEKWTNLSDNGLEFAKTSFSLESVGTKIKIMLEELISDSDVR